MADPNPGRRWPRRVYGVGTEPDPRFSFANERTFLAWIRTALGFIAAGAALSAVVQLGNGGGPEIRVASVLLVGCGLLCGVGALTRWAQSERAMRLDQPLPSSSLLVVLTVLVVLAALAAVLVLVTQ